MKATIRNYMWVRDAASAIAYEKKGLAKYCFTVGEVVQQLGFSRNTVQKYIDQMEEDKSIKKMIVSKSLTAYRFTEDYRAGLIADRVNTYQGRP